MPKLTAEEARDKFDQLRGLYSDLHTQIRENRRYYDLNFKNEVISPQAQAQGFKPVVPRTARRAIDEAVDHVLTFPKIGVPVRPTESDLVTQQMIAEKKRKFLNAWWRQVTQRSNIIGDGRKWLFLDGMIAVKHTFRYDLLPDKDDPNYRDAIKKLGKYEFMWKHELLNNEWVYPDPSNPRDPDYVYLTYTIRTEDAKRRWPDATGEWTKRSDYEKANYVEYWSRPYWTASGEMEPGQHYVWLDHELVNGGNTENPYPYIPIAIEDSGYGLNRIDSDPHERFVGLNQHSHSVFVAQARQWSAMEAVAELSAFAPLEVRNMDQEAQKKLALRLGAIWELEGVENDPDRQSAEFKRMPEIPQTVPQMIALTDREVNSALKSDILGGIPQKGVDTATEADQNVRNSGAKLQTVVTALERLAAKLSRWCLMDIELGAESAVTLFGTGPDDPADITLTTRDISGYYDVMVQLTTTDEEAMQLTKARFWLDAYQLSPFLSALTVLEAGGIVDDGLKELIRRQGEDVFLSEEYRLARQLEGANAMGELQQMAQQLIQAGAGARQQAGGANSAGRLLEQEDINSPVQSRVQTEAYQNRDVNQGGALNRG